MTDEAAVTQVLADYYSAFSTLDVQATLPYFHEPAMFVGSGGVFALPTSAELTAMFVLAMEGLRARGFGRSELSLQQLKVLSSTAALAIGVAIRYRIDGQELERVGVTYLLHKGGADWKIAVLVLHDALAQTASR